MVLPALALLSGMLAAPVSAAPVSAAAASAAAASRAGAAAAAAAHMVKVRAIGLDRDGFVVKHLPAVFLNSASGASYQSFGQALRLPTGGYLVGAEVPTGSASETLVVRNVTIRTSETITMNAERGRLVRVSLTGVHASQTAEAISACLENTGNMVISAAAYSGSGVKLYAVPFRSANVGFSYQASWLGPAGAGYNLTGSSAGGIPAHLGYSQAAGHLAELAVDVRHGVNPATSILWELSPGNEFQSLCSYSDVGGQTTEPFGTTQYVTPGLWTTRVDTVYQVDELGFNYLVAHFAARHRYTQTFGAALAGPGANFPDIDGNIFRFDATDLFDPRGMGPGNGGDQCCTRSTVVLRTGGHVVARAHLDQWRGRSYYEKVLTKAGWYTFDITAVRRNPHGSEPANMLSSRVTLAWRFHATPVLPAGIGHQLPVTVTIFEPRGLSMDNQALPGSTTALEFYVVRAGQPGDQAARYAFKTIRAQASFDDGKTWQTLTVSRHRGFWLTSVHDPASGFVALRSAVTDIRGDSTVQTIYRAYAVS